jgi:hypothetical protein
MTKFEDAVKALADHRDEGASATRRREHFLTCKPSELILLALEDLEKVEGLPGVYRIDMSSWHYPRGDACYVCLAGAALAGSYGMDPEEDFTVSLFGDNVEARCGALNSFRCGLIWEGLDDMEIKFDDLVVQQHIRIPEYETDPVEFKSGLRWIAKHLAERGL